MGATSRIRSGSQGESDDAARLHACGRAGRRGGRGVSTMAVAPSVFLGGRQCLLDELRTVESAR